MQPQPRRPKTNELHKLKARVFRLEQTLAEQQKHLRLLAALLLTGIPPSLSKLYGD